jgi:hypothetical protein
VRHRPRASRAMRRSRHAPARRASPRRSASRKAGSGGVSSRRRGRLGGGRVVSRGVLFGSDSVAAAIGSPPPRPVPLAAEL